MFFCVCVFQVYWWSLTSPRNEASVTWTTSTWMAPPCAVSHSLISWSPCPWTGCTWSTWWWFWVGQIRPSSNFNFHPVDLKLKQTNPVRWTETLHPGLIMSLGESRLWRWSLQGALSMVKIKANISNLRSFLFHSRLRYCWGNFVTWVLRQTEHSENQRESIMIYHRNCSTNPCSTLYLLKRQSRFKSTYVQEKYCYFDWFFFLLFIKVYFLWFCYCLIRVWVKAQIVQAP